VNIDDDQRIIFWKKVALYLLNPLPGWLVSRCFTSSFKKGEVFLLNRIYLVAGLILRSASSSHDTLLGELQHHCWVNALATSVLTSRPRAFWVAEENDRFIGS
jgi:hypothetical protein